jgi:hypothetical protein
MRQLFLVLLAFSAVPSHGNPAISCPMALSRMFLFGQLVPSSQHSTTLAAIRKHVFPGFSLTGHPDITPIQESSARDWSMRAHRVAGRLAFHEGKSSTELVEADTENPLATIQEYSQLVARPSAINFPIEDDPLGLLKGIRSLGLLIGVTAFPLTHLCMGMDAFPLIRTTGVMLSFSAFGMAGFCHSVIQASQSPQVDFGLAHAALHASPKPGEWVYSGVNLAFFIDEYHVAPMPFDAVTYVGESRRARTVFLIQTSPFRN